MTNLTRRNIIRLGLGGLAAGLAAPATTHASDTAATPRAKACIVLFMIGGASQIDTWDPKPGRETGGEFKAIQTRVSGLHISEHLPRLARRTDKLAVIRSLTMREGNHDRARYLMHTGYAPAGATAHPSLGAMVAEPNAGAALPGYVAISTPGGGGGFLGAQAGPLMVQNPTRPVRNLRPPARIGAQRSQRRARVWRELEAQWDRAAPVARGHRAVVEQGLAMVDAPATAAFNLELEPASSRARYGSTRFGAGCLMARRLVEAGVPFVEVGMRGWDTHDNNFERVKALSLDLDVAMSNLLDDLSATGLLDETLVVWLGDFGRTPRINGRGGRDHYPGVASAVIAGAGISGGQVIGATDIDGVAITRRPVEVPDLFRTIMESMGLDPDKTRITPGGRPISATDGGRPVSELWA